MADKLSVGVLFGGRSGEHEVSLISSRHILDALDREKYVITEIGITKQGDWLVGENTWKSLAERDGEDLTPAAILPVPNRSEVFTLKAEGGQQVLEVFAELDLIIPVLHGSFGEDGTLQGLLELADLAYVGAGVLGSAVAMDKALFKDVMVAHQIPVVNSLLVTRTEIQEDAGRVIRTAEALAPYPLFVKPANMGSSVGVHKCDHRGALEEGLTDAARFDRRILVERGVNAREIEVSVLGNEDPRASVPGEIRPKAEFYSYQAKYHDDSSELIIPAPLSEDEITQIQATALQAYRAIDCAGMARVDFLLDKDSGELFLNEINTIPGFTPISMYPKLWEASGLGYSALLDQLIQLALERKGQKDQTIWSYSQS